MSRLAFVAVTLSLACAPARTPLESGERTGRAPASASALLAALADTGRASRVYLPHEVDRPAESLFEPDRRIGALPTAVKATVLVAAVRGVVDTLGFAVRATLTVLPGSDPREGSILLRRAAEGRWRPARLVTGEAVRQLFEWRFCRDGNASCTHFEQMPMKRDVPRVDAR
jgi:hypothetical protein